MEKTHTNGVESKHKINVENLHKDSDDFEYKATRTYAASYSPTGDNLGRKPLSTFKQREDKKHGSNKKISTGSSQASVGKNSSYKMKFFLAIFIVLNTVGIIYVCYGDETNIFLNDVKQQVIDHLFIGKKSQTETKETPPVATHTSPVVEDSPPIPPVSEEKVEDIPPVSEDEVKDLPPVAENEVKDLPPVAENEVKDLPPVAENEVKDNIPVAEDEAKDIPQLNEDEVRDNITAVEEEVKDNTPVAEDEAKDIPPVAEDEVKDIPPVAEHEVKDNTPVTEDKVKDIPPVAEDEVKDKTPVAEVEAKDITQVAEDEVKDIPPVVEDTPLFEEEGTELPPVEPEVLVDEGQPQMEHGEQRQTHSQEL